MMRILITGGAGLIGSHCAEFYARKKAKVIVLDNLMRSRIFKSRKKSVEHNWDYLGGFKNITRIKGDVRDERDVKQALGKGVDIVIHAAGQPSFSASMIYPREDFAINACGTFNVLEAVRKYCPRAVFIYCSSNKVYGNNLNEPPVRELKTRYAYKDIKGITENMPLDMTGRTPYGASKLTGDIYAQEYAHTYGIRTGIFRMGCVYGPRQFGLESQGWETWFVIACLTRRMVTLFGNGKQVRDLMYVTDAVRAYDKFINSKYQHRVYNIGGGAKNSFSLLEFLEDLKIVSGIKPRIRFRPWHQGDQKVYITDFSRIRSELQWRPETSAKEGMKSIVDWVRANIKYFK